MRVGWATSDITPERPVVLRGQFHARISRRVNDPLLASALAIEGQGADGKSEQCVMVSCDRVGIPGSIVGRVRGAVASRAKGLDVRKVVLNATHTHTAPEIEEGVYPQQGPEVMTPTEYADLFVERVADCIVRAWDSRSDGGVSWGLGHAVVGHNRRASYYGGTSRMYGATSQDDFEHIEGYEDHSVDILFTFDASRQLTGVVVNLACPSQVSEGEHYVSADFWHEVRVELAQRLGEGVFVLPQCSAAGDQSPHPLLYKSAEERMYRLRGLSERQELARRIANTVADVLAVVKADLRTEVPLRHVVRTLGLPARTVTLAERDYAAAKLEEHERQEASPEDVTRYSYRFMMLRRYRSVVERFRAQGGNPTCVVDVHVVRLGDVAFATNPFELFLDYGLRIKARSKAEQTFVVQLAGPGTYLPTTRSVAGQGYGAEPVDNLVGPEGGRVLVEGTLQTLNSLWEEA